MTTLQTKSKTFMGEILAEVSPQYDKLIISAVTGKLEMMQSPGLYNAAYGCSCHLHAGGISPAKCIELANCIPAHRVYCSGITKPGKREKGKITQCPNKAECSNQRYEHHGQEYCLLPIPRELERWKTAHQN